MKNININPITALLLLVFIYPLAKGFFLKFSSINLKYEVEKVESTIIFIISLLLGIFFSKKIFFQKSNGIYKKIYDGIPHIITAYIEDKPSIIFIVIMPIFIFILYKLFIYITELLNKITLDPLLNVIESKLERRSVLFKRMVGVVFQLPRSICYIIFLTFLLNTLSVFNVTPSINKYLGQSKPYEYICKKVVIPITNSNVARQLPNILSDSFKVVEKDALYPNINNPSNIGNRTIIYYNGVTLEEGIKSNSEIDKLAVKLTSGETDDKVKANLLYSWVGKNISYDNDKASSVLNNNFSIKSGAIEAYNTRKGICFDYACLYVAMCRANGLKVRLITGEGFNGVSWVSHAWNQVYLKATNSWINVDTTFYNGGNYFNSKVFQRDHKNSKVAGEW